MLLKFFQLDKEYERDLLKSLCQIIICFELLDEKTDLTGRITRWILSILEDDVEIRYRSGKLQEHIDCLSRYPVNHPEEEEEEMRAVMAITFGREREPVHLTQERDDPTVPFFTEQRLSPTSDGDFQTTFLVNQMMLIDVARARRVFPVKRKRRKKRKIAHWLRRNP